MSAIKKIKKPRRTVAEVFFDMPMWERVIIFIPLVALVAVILWAVFWNPKFETSEAHASRELMLTSAGQWTSFDYYSMDVWAPSDLEEETVEEDKQQTEKLWAVRDKGHFPEITYGVIVVEEADGQAFDIAEDTAGILDVTTPLLTDALGRMLNGVYPAISCDIGLITPESGNTILEGIGEFVATVAYQDPKDSSNVWSEEVTQNLYYNIGMFYGRPVIVWGTWDYSTWEGETRTRASVNDGITSLMLSSGGIPVVPDENYRPELYANIEETTPVEETTPIGENLETETVSAEEEVIISSLEPEETSVVVEP